MKLLLSAAAIISVAMAHECDSPKSKNCYEFQTCCQEVCDQHLKQLGCQYEWAGGEEFEVSGTCECADPPVVQSSIDVDAYRQEVLDAHNTYRSLHGAPAMTLDAELNTAAQAWAKDIATVQHRLVHSRNEDRPGVGENLAWQSGGMPAGADTTGEWYEEIRFYDFDNPGFAGATGHFTQLIWKNSTKLGVGIHSDDTTGEVYTVARYSPAGNFGATEDYRANVLPKA